MHPPKNSDNIHIMEVAVWAINPSCWNWQSYSRTCNKDMKFTILG